MDVKLEYRFQRIAEAGACAGFLGVVAQPDINPAAIKALAVPHAGYDYSRPVAATAYNLLAPRRDQIKRVVLLGPSHRIPFRGLALPTSE